MKIFVTFIALFASRVALGQHVAWEALESHSYSTSTVPFNYRDEATSVLAFDTMVVAVGLGRENDSSGNAIPFTYVYAYNLQGRKLWEKRLSDYAPQLPKAVKVSDTSWALSSGFIYTPTTPQGQQRGGISLRLFNLEMQELWRWNYYENQPYNIQANLLPSPSGKVLLSVFRYDTSMQGYTYEVRTFLHEGVQESIQTTDPYSNTPGMLCPIAGNRWIAFNSDYRTPTARYHTVDHLDSSFHIVRADTMAALAGDNIQGKYLFSTPDGGYQILWWGAVGSSWDSTWMHIERHNSQGGLVWQRTLPRNRFASTCVEPISDGGWLWYRSGSRVSTSDSVRSYFERMDADGEVIWSVELPSYASTGQRVGYSFLDVAFDGQGGGYVCGQTKPLTGGANDRYAYVRKVTNLGMPFNPLSKKPSIVSAKGSLLAYPNPSSSLVHIEGMPAKAAHLYSMQGQHLQTVQLDGQGRGTANLSGLPKGVYVLRSQERAIRLVKE